MTVRLQASDQQAIVVLIGAAFALKADELEAFTDSTNEHHVPTWNRYIDHAHMFIEHLSNTGFVKKVGSR